MKALLLFVFCSLLSANAFAEAPNLLTYQGRLKEGGQAVSGNRVVEIRVCDDVAAGTCHTSGAQSVTVSNGLFRSTFTVPVTANFGAGDWYLEIWVAGTQLTPRERLTSGAYSLFSATATYATNIAAATGSDGVYISSNLYVNGGGKYYGDGSQLTNLPVSGGAVAKTGDTMTGQLTIVASSFTVMASDVLTSSLWVSTSASTPHLYISTGGRIGINTASPGAKLDVVVTDGLEPASIRSYAGNSNYTKIEHGYVEVKNNGGSVPFLDVDYTGTYGAIANIKDSGSSVFYIQNGGNVGIGTAAPTQALDVTGNIWASASMGVGESPNAGDIHIRKVVPGGAVRLYVENASNLPGADAKALIQVGGSGANDPMLHLSVSGVSDWTVGIDNSDADKFKISEAAGVLGANDRFTLQAGGNIGVSTGAPQARLDVLAGGAAQTDMAQIWRDSNGNIQSSMSATGVMMASRFIGGNTSLNGIIDLGDNVADLLTVNAQAAFIGGSTFTTGGAYFIGVSSFSNAANINIAGGTASQVLKKVAGGGMVWGDDNTGLSSLGTPYRLQMVNATGDGLQDSNFIQNAGATNITIVAGSSLTVTGNAFSVGGSTLVVTAGHVGINWSTPDAPLVVNAMSGETYIAKLGTSGINISIGGAIQTTGTGHGAISGNTRGIGAVDLQTRRTNATYVASGDYSALLGGYDNRATGNYSTVLSGYFNAADGVSAAVLTGISNTASASYAAVGGGRGNTASGTSSFIGGGGRDGFGYPSEGNTASQAFTAIAGGAFNVVSGSNSFIGAGAFNVATGTSSVIAGGEYNRTENLFSSVGGGKSNTARDGYATIGGGVGNYAGSWAATIGGGSTNNANNSMTTIGGGQFHTIDAAYGTVAGGNNNKILTMALAGFIGGGDNNISTGAYSTVGGGRTNTSSGAYSAVLGGRGNLAEGAYSSVGGGQGNTANSEGSTVSGGVLNSVTGSWSTVSGGENNSVSAQYSMVPGGVNNTASGNFSFAAGYGAQSTQSGAFTWADSTSEGAVNNVVNQVMFKAKGGFWVSTGTVYANPALFVDANNNVGIGTLSPSAALDVVSTGTLANQYAQIWRDSTGAIISSVSATGDFSANAGNFNGPVKTSSYISMGYVIQSTTSVSNEIEMRAGCGGSSMAIGGGAMAALGSVRTSAPSPDTTSSSNSIGMLSANGDVAAHSWSCRFDTGSTGHRCWAVCLRVAN